jgi:hypothetical protein
MIQAGFETLLPIAFGLLFLVIGGVITALIIVRLSRRMKQVPFLSALGIVGLAGSMLVGAEGTLVGLVKEFGAVGGESIDPSQKARLLGEGIAQGMNCIAFGVALWIPSLLIALVVERTIADQKEGGEPPST